MAVVFVAVALVIALIPQQASATTFAADLRVKDLPTVKGVKRQGKVLRANPGTWSGDEPEFTYQWLRSGVRIEDATAKRYRTTRADRGLTLSVIVTAHVDGGERLAVSRATSPIGKPPLKRLDPPEILGEVRYGEELRVQPAEWGREPRSRTYHWYRDGERIKGAKGPTYTVRARDVGSSVFVREWAKHPRHSRSRYTSDAERAKHRTPVLREVSYEVHQRGQTRTDIEDFEDFVAKVYADPRGWRAAGIRLKQVDEGGDFNLWVSQPQLVPLFSSACSADFSCRVGSNVILNDTPWQDTTAAWEDTDASLTAYRRMVLNHETGHWLGLGHDYCEGPGESAPVMQQQSKSLRGCAPSSWPTPDELAAVEP